MRGSLTIPLLLLVTGYLIQPLSGQEESNQGLIELVRYEQQVSGVTFMTGERQDHIGMVVVFKGTEDLHYYADANSAPLPGLELTVSPSSAQLTFAQAVYPRPVPYSDPALNKPINVYVGDFEVFLPILQTPKQAGPFEVLVTIKGIACTSQICLAPFSHVIRVRSSFDPRTQSWSDIALTQTLLDQTEINTTDPKQTAAPDIPTTDNTSYPMITYLLLAVVAGLSINIMPCVLPVIPLIVIRLVEQSRQTGYKRVLGGMAFCGGIVLFFAVFALISAVINKTTGTVLDLNSLFRYANAVIVLFLAMVFFGLMMLDVVTLGLPSFITGHQGGGPGMAGSLGMGFFAGILSTPCSGALLGFVLVWAQTQPLRISTVAILLMGIGMALPYALLVLIPSLLKRIPRPGIWMDLFKKSTGFLLFLIAVEITLTALPKERLINVLVYGVVFSFCVWMWGKWVDFSTPARKKWTVRLIAVALAVFSGLRLLPGPQASAMTWVDYDSDLIQRALQKEQPVLIKFTADWCTNCKVVERRVYQDTATVQLIQRKGVLAVKADTTSIHSPAYKDLKAVYGEAGNVPVTIVLLSDQRQEKLRGIFPKETLHNILNPLKDTER